MSIRAVQDTEKDRFLGEDGKALWASRPHTTRGRLYPESPSQRRGDFERDRDRVIHSKAFRRLKFKTQVFVYHEGDHYRSRLSHSIEVAQVARSLARLLKVDEDLAETCALAHDLGHTPFAHTGEDALNACMALYGGFSHNDQTLRVITLLERKYPQFNGLNLTWETLEGLIKHNGPILQSSEAMPLGLTLSILAQSTDFYLDSFASLEAQVAAIADDIAYNSHDIDDGLAAEFFTLEDLSEVAWVGDIVQQKRARYPAIDDDLLGQEVVREVMGTYIADVLAETWRRLEQQNPQNIDDIRHAKRSMVSFSADMEKKDHELRSFLWARFYRHHKVNRMRFKVYAVVEDLFKAFMAHRKCLPPYWQLQSDAVPEGWDAEQWHARTVADYIAGMTDRLAFQEHADLFENRNFRL